MNQITFSTDPLVGIVSRCGVISVWEAVSMDLRGQRCHHFWFEQKPVLWATNEL